MNVCAAIIDASCKEQALKRKSNVEINQQATLSC